MSEKGKAIVNTLEVVFICLLFIFMAAADSECILIPAVGVLSCLVMILLINALKATYEDDDDLNI
jgi:hypothetical protein